MDGCTRIVQIGLIGTIGNFPTTICAFYRGWTDLDIAIANMAVFGLFVGAPRVLLITRSIVNEL